MALPTGSGSEILKSIGGGIANQTSGLAVLTVPALHIASILSITIANVTGTKSYIQIAVDNGTPRFLVKLTYLQPYDTFVFNEKVVLEAGDILKLYEHDNQGCDYWISYIDQNWED